MIDDDFSPDRRQLSALGFLLIAHQHSPLLPAMREDELYEKVEGRFVGSEREKWLDDLFRHRLIKLVETGINADDRIGSSPFDVCLTAAGLYYTIGRASVFRASARTPINDFPDEIVDTPWAIQSYFSSSDSDDAPAADRFVRFDDNQIAFTNALRKIEDVFQSLKSDNEIGSAQPDLRDEKLNELKEIREILEAREGWQSKLVVIAYGALAFISTEFATRPVGFLAEQAWEAIQEMLGLLV